MGAQERREAIAVAAIPLLAEHGSDVTTGQIAKAARIAEGTVFRVFKDKQELLDFCVWRAFQTHETIERIAGIPTTKPLTERMVEAIGMFAEQMGRAGALMHALGATGYRPDESKHEPGREHPMAEEFKKATEAIATLLTAGPEVLRTPADSAANYLLGLTFVSQMQAKRSGQHGPSVEEIVDLFLNGAVENGAVENPEGCS
jgi:AcrR family transcriptional regulator